MLRSKTLVPVSLGPILAGHCCFKAEEEVQDLQLLFLRPNSCMEAHGLPPLQAMSLGGVAVYPGSDEETQVPGQECSEPAHEERKPCLCTAARAQPTDRLGPWVLHPHSFL